MTACSLKNYGCFLKKAIQASLIAASVLYMASSHATIVQFQTNMGDFTVNLYDKATPKTVENFLTYVKANAYKNAIVHRTVNNFVVQGGGFKVETTLPLLEIPQNARVINEPVYANKRGTIAMAKFGDQPHSATNQWFFNLKDNSGHLDSLSEGFTVFGEVTGNGMAIVDAMAALSRVNLGQDPFTELPMIKYTQTDLVNKVTPKADNFVLIQNIVVLDANIDTAAALTPALSTKSSSNSGQSGGGSSGGGSIGLLGLMMLSCFSLLMIGVPKARPVKM